MLGIGIDTSGWIIVGAVGFIVVITFLRPLFSKKDSLEITASMKRPLPIIHTPSGIVEPVKARYLGNGKYECMVDNHETTFAIYINPSQDFLEPQDKINALFGQESPQWEWRPYNLTYEFKQREQALLLAKKKEEELKEHAKAEEKYAVKSADKIVERGFEHAEKIVKAGKPTVKSQPR